MQRNRANPMARGALGAAALLLAGLLAPTGARADWPMARHDARRTGEAPGKIGFHVNWGPYRLEITDPATGLTTRFPFTAGWSYDDDNRGLDARPDKVKLALDRSQYRAGETLTLTVTPPHAGAGLLLVETDQLLHSEPFDAKPAGTTLRLTVDERWERHDVYLTALVFRPGTASDKITPSRAVGIAHVPIDRSDRTIAVEIAAPDKYTVQFKLAEPRPANFIMSAIGSGWNGIVRKKTLEDNGYNLRRVVDIPGTGPFKSQRRVEAEIWVMDPKAEQSLDNKPLRDTDVNRVRSVDGVAAARG